MNQVPPERKKQAVREHIEEARTLKSLAAEYGVTKSTIANWVKAYREECQTNSEAKKEYEIMRENRKLRLRNQELEKENQFLKKAAAFFAKEIG